MKKYYNRITGKITAAKVAIEGAIIMDKTEENKILPIEVELKKGEKYYCVHAGKLQMNHFATIHILNHHSVHWNLKLRKTGERFFAHARKQKILHIATDHMRATSVTLWANWLKTKNPEFHKTILLI